MFRREKLLPLNLTVGKQPPDRYTLTLIKEAGANQIVVRNGWLSLK